MKCRNLREISCATRCCAFISVTTRTLPITQLTRAREPNRVQASNVREACTLIRLHIRRLDRDVRSWHWRYLNQRHAYIELSSLRSVAASTLVPGDGYAQKTSDGVLLCPGQYWTCVQRPRVDRWQLWHRVDRWQLWQYRRGREAVKSVLLEWMLALHILLGYQCNKATKLYRLIWIIHLKSYVILVLYCLKKISYIPRTSIHINELYPTYNCVYKWIASTYKCVYSITSTNKYWYRIATT